MKCPYCNKENPITTHIYGCSDKKDKKEIKYEYILFNYPSLDINTFKDLYINKKYSLVDFKKKYNLAYSSTNFLLDYYNITKRNHSDATKLGAKKTRKTLQEKYNVDNVSQLESIKKKKELTCLKNHGVTNIRKSEKFKEYINNIMLEKYGQLRITNSDKIKEYYSNRSLEDARKHREKIKNTKEKWSEEFYEEWVDKIKKANILYWDIPGNKEQVSIKAKERWELLPEEEKIKRIKKLHGNNNPKTELIINKILEDFNITYTRQYPLNGFYYDFLLNDYNIVIEVNGDFWHANPLKYKPNDVLNFPLKEVKAKDIWKKDWVKYKTLKKKNLLLITIWEHEINSNKFLDELILNRIANTLDSENNFVHWYCKYLENESKD
jgi:G:T-mismatch repair DNA endonuclease (very short patch repair protein)